MCARRLTAVLWSSIFALLFCTTGSAQSHKHSLTIRVADPSGAPVRRARVTVSPRDARLPISQETDIAGEARFDALLESTYVVDVEASGFARVARIVAVDSKESTLIVALALAGVTERVVVTGAGRLQTAAEVSKAVTVVDGDEIKARNEFYGRLDVGLSARGREQMRHARRLLREAPCSAIYSSPQRRAFESASVLAGRRAPVTVDNRLREIDFGDFEGLPYNDIAERYSEKYEEWMTRPTEVVFPCGESFGAMAARVREALHHIRRTHPIETVAIVSHGGVNRIALATALELDARRIFRLDQAYACVNVIDYIGDEPLVRLINAAAQVPC